MKKQLPYVQNDISIIKERNNTLSRGIDTQSIIIFSFPFVYNCHLDNNGKPMDFNLFWSWLPFYISNKLAETLLREM